MDAPIKVTFTGAMSADGEFKFPEREFEAAFSDLKGILDVVISGQTRAQFEAAMKEQGIPPGMSALASRADEVVLKGEPGAPWSLKASLLGGESSWTDFCRKKGVFVLPLPKDGETVAL